MTESKACPIIVCGESEVIGAMIIEGLKPGYEGESLVTDVSPQLSKGYLQSFSSS